MKIVTIPKNLKNVLFRTISQTSEDIDKYTAFKLFNDPKYDIYSKLFKSWSGTIHTSMYEPKHLKAWMTLGENRPLIYRLSIMVRWS